MSEKLKVELLEVKSISRKLNEQWQDLFNIRVMVDGIELNFESDLKNGLVKEIENIFKKENYNYTSFYSKYGRKPKERKIGF